MVDVDERSEGGPAGKVVWHVTTSLDGFIADPDDSVEAFHEESTGFSALGAEVIRTTGVFVAGGRMFRVPEVGYIYGGAWEGEVFIYTRNPREAPDGAPYRYVTGDIRGVVGEALKVAAARTWWCRAAPCRGCASRRGWWTRSPSTWRRS